jgi:hypothetical protein
MAHRQAQLPHGTWSTDGTSIWMNCAACAAGRVMAPNGRRRRPPARTVVALGAFLIALGGSRTSNAQSECLSAKLEAIGQREARLLFCLAKVAARGRATTFGACDQRARIRYAAAFGRAGSCDGDRTQCECLAENCAVDLRVQLSDPGPSKCEAARLKAAGKEAIGKVHCNVKALREGLVVDQTCTRRAEKKFQAAFAKTRRCAGDQSTAEAIVNAECVAALGGDATGGGMITDICTSDACEGVDARRR